MKKIMFSDRFALTQAVLEGRKTQTRRIINPQPEVSERMGMVWKGYGYGITSPAHSPYFLRDVYRNFLSGTNYPQCRRYKLGEVLAVAQSYRNAGYDVDALDRSPKDFRVVRGTLGQSKGWNNKMFVRADGCKNRIRITNVRVERLQDISDEDCIKEGVELNDRQYEYDGQKFYCVRGLGYWRGIGCDNFNSPREAYAALIDKISGKGTWERNPYVFVYDFELVK